MNTVTRVTRFSPASLVSPAGGRLLTATTPHGRAACDRRASCGKELEVLDRQRRRIQKAYLLFGDYGDALYEGRSGN